MNGRKPHYRLHFCPPGHWRMSLRAPSGRVVAATPKIRDIRRLYRVAALLQQYAP